MGVIEGDAADLEADTARVRLETILLEMPPSAAQITDAQESAVLHFVSLALAPGTLVVEFIASPVPWAVDGFLDAANMPCGEGGRCRGEGVGDVAAEAAVSVRASEATGGLEEDEAVVRELFLHICDLVGMPGDLSVRSPMADDFCT